MKRLLALIMALAVFAAPSVFAADKYVLDSQHSYVMWQISHFGFSSPTGKWMANGSMMLDKDKPQNSSVEATIDVADMITGIPELDNHLRGKLFFDTEQFPTATYVSDRIEVTGKKTAIVHGKLTVKGITKPVNIKVKLNKAGKNVINNKMTVGFSGMTIVKRSDFGMTTLLPGLGDEVRLTIEVEAYKSAQNGIKNDAKAKKHK